MAHGRGLTPVTVTTPGRASSLPWYRAPLPARAVARIRLVPWWLRVLVVFVLARIVTTVFLLVLAAEQPANAWTAASPNYFEFANIWDARWYGFIAFSGYPSELPLDDTGHVAENAWAFMPVYPFLVRAVMLVTWLPWDVASVVVSVIAGLGAALVFYRLMSRVLDADRALFATVLFSFAPLAPIFQVGYAESLFLFFLLLALLLLVDRRYGWLFPVIAIMSFTRPGALPLALALGLHVIYRWFTRERDPFPVRERVASASVTVFAGLAGVAWLGIAAVVTGSLTAYTDTELAWRAPYIGRVELIPFTAWFQSADWWLGQPLGTIMVISLIVVFGLVLLSPAVRRLGIDLRLWLLSYALYLLAVFFPQSSVFRLLLPMSPLLGALAVPRSLLYRVAAVAGCIVLQWGWLLLCWRIDGADWTPP